MWKCKECGHEIFGYEVESAFPMTKDFKIDTSRMNEEEYEVMRFTCPNYNCEMTDTDLIEEIANWEDE